VQVGLRKLLDAEGEVNVMKQELIALQPELIKTGVLCLSHCAALHHCCQSTTAYTPLSAGFQSFSAAYHMCIRFSKAGKDQHCYCILLLQCYFDTLPLVLCCPAGKEVEETLHIVDAQTQEAAAKKQVVEGEEAIASEKAAAAKAIKVCAIP
jgi:hypothetical protein